MKRFAIDFYEQFDLLSPVAGLVEKVTSPKGIRHKVDDEYTSFALHADLRQVYHTGEECIAEPGLYHVLDICKVKGVLIWCHYLFIIDPDGTVYPVGEYLNEKNSRWIPKAIGTIKDYFKGKELDPIELTYIPRPKPRMSAWEHFKRS